MANDIKHYESLRSLRSKPSDQELLASRKVLALKMYKEYCSISKNGKKSHESANNSDRLVTQDPLIYSISDLLKKRKKFLKNKIFVQ